MDVRAIGCDFLACSAYKFYGPHVGVLYGRRERLEALDVPKLEPAPDTAPERLETGTQNHEGIAGAAAAVEFLASLADGPDPGGSGSSASSRPCTRAGRRCVERLWDGLGDIHGVTLYGPPPGRPRTPTVSFTVAGRSSDEVGHARWRRKACSRRTATSTPRRWSSGWDSRAGDWCGPGAPATPRRRRSTASWPRSRVSGRPEAYRRLVGAVERSALRGAATGVTESAARAWYAKASARSGEAATQLRWPIFRPRLGSVLP